MRVYIVAYFCVVSHKSSSQLQWTYVSFYVNIFLLVGSIFMIIAFFFLYIFRLHKSRGIALEAP